MDVFEQKKVLDSFEILVDTREQDTERAHKRYASFGVPIRRAALNYGDYTYNATLPDGKQIHDISQTVIPVCAVERKMNLDERQSATHGAGSGSRMSLNVPGIMGAGYIYYAKTQAGRIC